MHFNQVVNEGAVLTSEVEVQIRKTALVFPEPQPGLLSFLGSKAPTQICRYILPLIV